MQMPVTRVENVEGAIKDVSISGTTVTVTFNDGATKTLTTQDRPSDSKAYIVETYHNGTEWYRVWSDGWIEQGGWFYKDRDVAKQITFLKPFANTDYTIAITTTWDNGSEARVESNTETSFSVYTDSWHYKAYWVCCGRRA